MRFFLQGTSKKHSEMNDMIEEIELGIFKPFSEVKPDKAQALKVLEEGSEVFGAWQIFDSWKDGVPTVTLSDQDVEKINKVNRIKLVDECADVCQAVANMIYSIGVTQEEWTCAITRCHFRNAVRGRY